MSLKIFLFFTQPRDVITHHLTCRGVQPRAVCRFSRLIDPTRGVLRVSNQSGPNLVSINAYFPLRNFHCKPQLGGAIFAVVDSLVSRFRRGRYFYGGKNTKQRPRRDGIACRHKQCPPLFSQGNTKHRIAARTSPHSMRSQTRLLAGATGDLRPSSLCVAGVKKPEWHGQSPNRPACNDSRRRQLLPVRADVPGAPNA